MPRGSFRFTVVLSVAGVTAATAVAVAAANAPVYVRPGAPGEPTQRISPRELSDAMVFPYTEADVNFVQGMIPHHGQALVMSEWAVGDDLAEGEHRRAEAEELLTLARRIHIVQRAEINRMQDWLEDRGEDVPDARDWDGHDMPGMVSEEELDELESLEGSEFDIRFLELMIPHHQGAITMVNRLRDAGGGFEPNISALASQITADQRAEIGRMEHLLERFRGD